MEYYITWQSNIYIKGEVLYIKWQSIMYLLCHLICMTLTDFTLHFSCCFTKILHTQLNPLLNNFTMQEKCY